MKKTLLTSIGILSLILGILGVIIPLLPTTPFLLLSSFLFLKSSSKLHLWLLNNKYLGKYIKDFEQEKSIPLKVKITSLTLLWLTISYSALFIVKLLWLKILLLAIAIAVTLHILHYKTRK
ncbi:MAG: ybaN [Bacteroidetes bacterium]|nr:ybaN [Bacteroidota bacterium]